MTETIQDLRMELSKEMETLKTFFFLKKRKIELKNSITQYEMQRKLLRRKQIKQKTEYEDAKIKQRIWAK